MHSRAQAIRASGMQSVQQPTDAALRSADMHSRAQASLPSGMQSDQQSTTAAPPPKRMIITGTMIGAVSPVQTAAGRLLPVLARRQHSDQCMYIVDEQDIKP
jgi:hypothetical protein